MMQVRQFYCYSWLLDAFGWSILMDLIMGFTIALFWFGDVRIWGFCSFRKYIFDEFANCETVGIIEIHLVKNRMNSKINFYKTLIDELWFILSKTSVWNMWIHITRTPQIATRHSFIEHNWNCWVIRGKRKKMLILNCYVNKLISRGRIDDTCFSLS